MKTHVLALVFGLAAACAQADTPVTYPAPHGFEDTVFGLENALLNRGLVLDSVSHVGEMLERTRADIGSDVMLFTRADVFSFCSAALSREVMEADPMNLQFCPYGIFVAEHPDGTTVVGYRAFPKGEMQKVQALLDAITREAAGLE
ncbi:uncharacterized protein DUF302 [Rhodovulum imhoffii]|uniref:Uncharacterized protein DUF302 n=1 Tax=Rhodovulum imhoffii TaxID=365340 RepID=A0A2T5BQM2_9RHOB|nr:DUF302 domain-containing protein [Rhodovulum imhoffii]MBK5934275.1 DUF302 domain-containing protein [Rhodovulum imhoffii]PTN01450.1 uncharacterized protein DUF302 [Rhodovulum imhoffii]